MNLLICSSSKNSHIIAIMGAIWWGHGGHAPTFSDGGTQYAMSPHFFLSRFCIWRGFKNQSDVCHVSCKELFMSDGRLDHTKPSWCCNRVWYGITDSVSLQILIPMKIFLAFFKLLETVKDL